MPAAYTVSYSQHVKNALKELSARAAQVGLGDEVLRAVKTIDDRLHLDPLGFGDPWFELRGANLLVMVKVIPPLSVIYGVHKKLPVVFPKKFRAFPADAF